MVIDETRIVIVENYTDLEGLGKPFAYCIETGKFYYHNGADWQCAARVADIVEMLEGMPSGSSDWDDIENKPASFPPSEHEHDYAATGHDHTGVYSPVGHAHAAPDWSDILGKPDTFTPSAHSHDYAASNHNHDAAYSAIGHTHNYAAVNHLHTKSEIEQVLTGEITTHTHPGGGGGDTQIATELTASNSAANSLKDVTGAAFNVTSGVNYRFEVFIPYSSAATTTGSRWVVQGPAGTYNYTSEYTLTATAVTKNCLGAVNLPAACNASSLTVGNLCTIWGVFTPSANGIFKVQFASEILNSAITARPGSIKYRTF